MVACIARAVHRPGIAASLCIVVCLMVACATNPVTGKREFSLVSEQQEIDLGKQSDQDVRKEMGVYEDQALQQYVQDVGTRLARASERPALPWQFAVADTPVVNAFAMPGGYIYVTRGLLAHLDTESQLAAVLGHEIGHVTARHSVQAYTRGLLVNGSLALTSVLVPKSAPYVAAASVGMTLLFLKYDRNQELQADQLGAGYIARQGWAPAGMSEVLTELGRLDAGSDSRRLPNWLLTHPQPADRVAAVRNVVTALDGSRPAGGWTINRDGYWARLPGLMYGDNPRYGVVQANRFIHPDLRFQLAFPQGWAVQNSATQVSSQAAGDDQAGMLLEMVDQVAGQSIETTATTAMESAGYRLIGGDNRRLNGLAAFVGIFEGGKQDTKPQRVEAAFISYNTRLFMLAGIASPVRFGDLVSTFDRTIASFAPLSGAEAATYRPSRLSVMTAQPGDSWQRIAERTSKVASPAELAVMNGFAPTEPPPAGRRLKVVVPG